MVHLLSNHPLRGLPVEFGRLVPERAIDIRRRVPQPLGNEPLF